VESFAAACGSSEPQAISGLEGLRALSVAPAVKQSSTSGRTEAVEIEPPATVRSPNRDLVHHPSEIAL